MRLSGILLALAALCLLPLPAGAIEFGLPAACTIGRDCFVQQFPDMDPGPGATDPFCGGATYDGHAGLDLRILSLPDIERGVPVVAMAEGTVLRGRDGIADALAIGEAARAAVAGRECGNGVIVAHADGYETQYCHLRRGSIAVRPGQQLTKGDRIGDIGASGMAQFPHVHVTVRKDGKEIDPSTGRRLDAGCAPDPPAAQSLFAPDIAEKIGRGESALLAFGLTGAVFRHVDLVARGAPAPAAAGSEVTLGWAWFANLKADDRVRFQIVHPDGSVFIDETGDPVGRAKADYSQYTGRKRPAVAGTYAVTVTLLRGGATVIERSGKFEVR